MKKLFKILVPSILLGIGLSSCNNEDVLINDDRWPNFLVEQQGSGVYSIPENCPTPNTLRLRVNYYFATEDTGLLEGRQIASSGLWTISENLVFESSEIANAKDTSIICAIHLTKKKTLIV